VNWEAFGAIAEMVGAGAVVATLLYLAVQLRSANRQAELESFRHTWDGLNQFCDLLSASREIASVVNRGRESLTRLDADEVLMFEHLHIRLLNTMESWHLQIIRTSSPGKYRDTQLANLSGIAAGYLGFPGTRDFWKRTRDYFLPIQELVDEALASAEGAV
jgi:hypothetical protein